MKRKTVKAYLCVALTALTLSMTACGGSGDKGTAATQEAEASSDGATLEDYLKGDAETAKQLEEQAQSMGNENVDMAIEVNGNDLVYIATLKEEIEDGDALVDAVEQMGSVFSALAGMMDEAIDAEKGTVSFGIRYCQPDGTVIAESEFRAE